MPTKTPTIKSSGSGKSQPTLDIAAYNPVGDNSYKTFGQLQVHACGRIPQAQSLKQCQSCIEKSASAGGADSLAYVSSALGRLTLDDVCYSWRSRRRPAKAGTLDDMNVCSSRTSSRASAVAGRERRPNAKDTQANEQATFGRSDFSMQDWRRSRLSACGVPPQAWTCNWPKVL